MPIRSVIILLTILTTFTSWSLDERQFKSLNDELENHVNKGNLNTALQLSNYLLKKKLNESQRYNILTTRSKIHFWAENLHEFNRDAKEAFTIKKNDSEIYRAYYYAQKSAFFHYFMLGDSAVSFSDRSMKILRKNWNSRKEIPFHFIYQLYGTTFIYRVVEGRDYSNSVRDLEIGLHPILNYLDSALHYINQVEHYNQENAIIFRSKGNRIMDAVGYTIRNNISDFSNFNFQNKMSNFAIKEYKNALNSLSQKEHTLSFGIKSLLALAYYCTNRQNQGDQILWPIIQHLEKKTIYEINSDNIQLLNVLQTFTHNIISRRKTDSRIYSVIRIYKSLRDKWYYYLVTKNRKYLDSYGQSPTSMLSLIYIWQNKLGSRKTNFLNDLRYSALDNYIFYSKKLTELVKKNKISQTNKRAILGYLDVKEIQKKLSQKSALLVRVFASMGKECFLLVSKNEVKVDSFQRLSSCKLFEKKNINILDFKRAAYQNFISSPFSSELRKTQINKLYVSIDIDEYYDFMVTDTIGNSFDELNYFKRKINVVKVFNPIDFFNGKSISQSQIQNKISPFLISIDQKNKLPFSIEVFTDPMKLKVEKLKNFDLNSSGIAHIIGHGNLKLDKDYRSFTNVLQSNKVMIKAIINSRLKTDLFVLNFCFGAHKREMFYPDRDLQNNLISRGAKAVIASPFETVDQSSAFIFKKFYRYIKQGITVEDALYKAKLDYLKSHKGSLAHPIYWSTYELTTNVRDLKLNIESNEESDFSKRIWLVSSIVFLLLVISVFLFKFFRKSPLN